MRALVLDDDGRLRLDRDHPEPTPGPNEALVHVRLAGVCATDLELTRGYAGFRGVLGHEFVGLVDREDPHWPGRRVVADINIGCGRCPACLTSDGHHCRARTTLGIRGRPGVFAERVAVPRAKLVAVPDEVDDERAVFAEPLAAALHVLDDAPDEGPITVLGDGKLGILIALSLRAAGRSVELIGRHPAKLAIAEGSGIPTLLEPDLEDAPRSSMIVEATGNPSGLSRALQLVHPRGTIVLKTTTAGPSAVDLTPLVVNELRLVGSRCGDMRRAVDLLASGRLDPRPLIAARYLLDDAERALAHAAAPGVAKILIAP
ncbi:MAG: alcohol dehydrogenase catalytic domain-containing protein [Enhygromyxa sp.]